MRTRPDVIGTVQLPSGRVSVDEAGYLIDPDDWSREFAEMVADQEAGFAVPQVLKKMHIDPALAGGVLHARLS